MDLMSTLEAQAIAVIQEVIATSQRPAVLFSGGKDSAVLVRLAQMAFRPAPPPVRLLHIDTGHNFPEVQNFIDTIATETELPLIRAAVQDWIDDGRLVEPTCEGGRVNSRNRLQTPVLLSTLKTQGIDVAMGGARRDEDRARAKEHLVSVRDAAGHWDPLAQQPEPWDMISITTPPGGHARAFPLSNWTERDVWRYIIERGVSVPSLYFAHRRNLVVRDGRNFAVTETVPAAPGESVIHRWCRFRTVGDITCTTATVYNPRTGRKPNWPSKPAEVLEDLLLTGESERGSSRADDDGEAAMEDRKAMGYF